MKTSIYLSDVEVARVRKLQEKLQTKSLSTVIAYALEIATPEIVRILPHTHDLSETNYPEESCSFCRAR